MSKRFAMAKVVMCAFAIYVVGPLLVVGLPTIVVSPLSLLSQNDEVLDDVQLLKRLFVGSRRKVNKPITTTLVVDGRLAGRRVTFRMAPGLTLAPRESATKRIPPPHQWTYSQVSWKVQASQEGEYWVQARVDGQEPVCEELEVHAGGLRD
jgi:hypothetical protein